VAWLTITALLGAILADMYDEWQSGERRYVSETENRYAVP
jgi:hypothetical protein